MTALKDDEFMPILDYLTIRHSHKALFDFELFTINSTRIFLSGILGIGTFCSDGGGPKVIKNRPLVLHRDKALVDAMLGESRHKGCSFGNLVAILDQR